jgi:hypothetical protein
MAFYEKDQQVLCRKANKLHNPLQEKPEGKHFPLHFSSSFNHIPTPSSQIGIFPLTL